MLTKLGNMKLRESPQQIWNGIFTYLGNFTIGELEFNKGMEFQLIWVT